MYSTTALGLFIVRFLLLVFVCRVEAERGAGVESQSICVFSWFMFAYGFSLVRKGS